MLDAYCNRKSAVQNQLNCEKFERSIKKCCSQDYVDENLAAFQAQITQLQGEYPEWHFCPGLKPVFYSLLPICASVFWPLSYVSFFAFGLFLWDVLSQDIQLQQFPFSTVPKKRIAGMRQGYTHPPTPKVISYWFKRHLVTKHELWLS